MEKIDTLLHAKWIITCDEPNRVLENHALGIHQGKIHAILPTDQAKMRYTADNTHHFSEHALLPGLINSHTHLAMNAFRGLADDLALMDWLNNYIWPAEGKWVSDELVHDMSLLAMAEMIRGGITCFNDMYFFLEATAKAAEAIHMRANIGMTVIGVPTAWAQTPAECFAKSLAFYDQYKNHALIKPTLAPHSTYTVDIKDLIKVKELSEEYNLQINIHLQEAPAEIAQSLKDYQKRPLQRLHDIGMVSPRLIAVHMTQINADDVAILSATRPHIVNCPESNMKLVSGLCPVQKLLDLNLNVALGTDGAASNNDLDMIGEMRSAAFSGKIAGADPRCVAAESTLKMATMNGAKALAIDHITGSLTAGKAADVIAIDLGQLETQPVYHPISQIVYAASRSQVSDVWIAGKQVLKHRELLTIDANEIIQKARGWGRKIGGFC